MKLRKLMGNLLYFSIMLMSNSRYYSYYLRFLIVLTFFLTKCVKESIQKDKPFYESEYCDSLEALGIIDDYKFPVIPGTSEWEQLTGDQRDSVLQIPEDILGTMCTNGLIETCLNWPFLWHCMIYEHFTTWWYMVDQSFNGIRELTERTDAPKKVINRLNRFNEYPYSDTITSYTLKNKITAQLVFMELFLAREKVQKTLTINEKLLLGKRVKELWDIQNTYDTILSPSVSPSYSCFLMGRMMYFDNYEPLIKEMSSNKELNNFINIGSYIYYYDKSYEFIINNFDNYLNHIKSK